MSLSRISLGSLLLISAIAGAGCHPASNKTLQSSSDGLFPEEQLAIAKKVDKLELVAEGTNTQISYKAPAVGDIYVYDDTTGNQIFVGVMKANDRFVFEPASNRAEINRKRVDLEMLSNGRDNYKVYFMPQ